MLVPGVGVQTGFEWRAQTGRWRWLILGAIGVAPLGCGGRSDNPDTGSSDASLRGNGGVAGSAGAPGQAGAGSGGASSNAGAGGAGAASAASACEPPLTDLGGGWERCGNGMIHRRELGSCASSVPRPEPRTRPDPAAADAGALSGECRYDSDCTQLPYGHCELDTYSPGTFCQYGCVTDADCGPGYVCLCGEPVGECRAATCNIDGDCGAGLLCSDFIFNPGCGGQAFACQQADDTCAADSDCPEYQYCTRGTFAEGIAADAPRVCSPAQCAIGRPFLVAGGERLASPVPRSDWYAASGLDSSGASPDATSANGPSRIASAELREAVRAGWLEQALMEHASVAAFARFSLQLLALGAPAELCSQAARAMQDEIEHARACFEQARRHSPEDVGPGPLDLSGAFEATDLEAIVLATIDEGCIGETVAAIEAAEALAHCTDAAPRAALARIARDETAHAELAWRFVAWALEVGPAQLRERVRGAFADAGGSAAAAASGAPSVRDLQLARHGLIAPSLRAELRRRVLRDVIEPCALALLDGTPSAARPLAVAAHETSLRARALHA